MSRQVYRYEVPIDDKPHTFALSEFPSHNIATAIGPEGAYVEFWALHDDDAEKTFKLTFQVYGTGHKLPDEAYVFATAPRISGLVFHLVELGTGIDD